MQLQQESVYQYSLARKKVNHQLGQKAATSPTAVAEFLHSIGLGDNEQEVLIVVHISARGTVWGYTEIYRGTGTGIPVEARDVFRAAVCLGAHSIVLAHNHPSGSVTPSEADLKCTVSMAAAGAVLGIEVQDHIVVNDDGDYCSIRQFMDKAEKGEV
jgi:DNA repair protein RadC